MTGSRTLGLSAALLLLAPGAGRADLTHRLQRETSILTRLEQLGGQVVSVEEQLDDLKQEQTQLRHQVGEARRRIEALGRRDGERQVQLRRRARSLYKLSRGGMVRLVLDSARGGDLSRRLAAGRLILRGDAREIALYRDERQRLMQERARVQHKLDGVARIQRQLEAKQRELQQARADQQQLLRRLQRSRKARGQMASQLNRQQQWLLRRIAELTYQVHKAGGLAARRGRLHAPVPGPLVGVFGQRLGRRGVELSGPTRAIQIMRHGVTFRPPARARVRAAAVGTVRLAAVLDGYGQLVLLEHDGGYFTLYGHLSRLEVHEGDRVKQGQCLGRAGLDPLTGRSSTYFEIRRGERPLDPSAWIKR